MSLQQLSQEGDTPHPALRLDAETQKKVIALAAQLQARHQETVSVAELEDTAAEVGLHAIFVRQALSQISSTPVAAAPSPWNTQRLARRLREQWRDVPVRGALLVLGLSALCGLGRVEFNSIPLAYGGFALAGLAGVSLGNAWKAFWVGTAAMAMEMTIAVLSSHGGLSMSPGEYVLPAVAGGLGSLTALIRVHCSYSGQNSSRQKDTTPTAPV